VRADELEELVRVAGLADHLKTRPLEHARDALAQKHVIVGHDDATAGGRLCCHDRPTLRRCPVAGTGKSLPPVCKEVHWSAFGARAFDAIFVE
jgi:hypothetical protein